MADNTVSIRKDVDGKPIPQYYNILQDVYEVLQGRNGAQRVELYDADGNPVDLETLLAAIVTALGNVTVSSSALPSGAATAAKQDILKTAIDAVATLITSIKDRDATKTHYGNSTDTKPTTGNVKGDKYYEINTGEVYMWDGTDWVVI